MNSRWLYFLVHGRKPPRRAPRIRWRRGPLRDWRYRAWIRTLPCAACGTTVGIEAAHTGQDGGMRQKSSDDTCIPLCWDCHQGRPDSYHRDREACERRILRRIGLTIRGLVRYLNEEWILGKDEAA